MKKKLMLITEKQFDFPEQLKIQTASIESSYNACLHHYLTNLISQLKHFFQIKSFQYIGNTARCNPTFEYVMENLGDDYRDWIEESLRESSQQFLYTLSTKLNKQSRVNIGSAEEIIEECDHYTQILSHFPKVAMWQQQIDQYKFEMSLLSYSYQIHRQLLIDIFVLNQDPEESILGVLDDTHQTLPADLKSFETVLTGNVISTLGYTDHNQPKTLLTFLHAISEALLNFIPTHYYQTQLQKKCDLNYIDLYQQLRSSLTSWREIVHNLRKGRLKEYARAFEACIENYSKLELLHSHQHANNTDLNEIQKELQNVSITDKPQASKTGRLFDSNFNQDNYYSGYNSSATRSK